MLQIILVIFIKDLILAATCESSGDSSRRVMIAQWTVDQEVVGSNPTHGRNLISVVRSLSRFTQPIR